MVGELEPSNAAAYRTRESALLVPKEFTFQKRFRERSTVERNKRLGCSGATLMNQLREQFFPCPAFAAQQHGSLRPRSAFGELDEFLDSW